MSLQQQLVRLVTSRRQLDDLYGEGYFDHLLKALDAWKSALADQNMMVEEPFVLCEELAGGHLPHALKERLSRLNHKPADAVVILGGPDVVPFFPVRSPEFLISADGDTHILSDDPYVAFDRHNVLYKPECAVGRLPDGGAGRPDLLINLVERSTAYHRVSTPITCTPVGLASAVWRNESSQVLDFGDNSLYICPPCGLPEQACAQEYITPAWLQAYNLHYYNVQGARSNAAWYGQCSANDCSRDCATRRISLLNTDAVPSLRPAVIFSEASYSASITPLDHDNLAVRFLQQGAVCYVGATAAAYSGQPGSPLDAADRIAQAFIEGVRQNARGRTQLTAGELLKRAKLNYQVRDNFDRKTLVEFVLFGDPTLVPFRQQGSLIYADTTHAWSHSRGT